MTYALVSSSYFDADIGLQRYLQEVKNFPMLDPEEEDALARRWYDHGDLKAAHRLVTSHLRLVVKVAMSYRGYGLPLADLIAEGTVGLMHGVKKFDPNKGFRLATYALWWIKASIQEFVLHQWSLVKIGTTAAQKKLFFNLRRLKARLAKADNKSIDSVDAAAIAARLNVPVADVLEMDKRLLTGGDRSLNTPLTNNDDDTSEWGETLADPAPSPELRLAEDDERQKRTALLHQALMTLNDRERAIFTARRLSDPAETLDALAACHGISRERVRQIEARAMEKVVAKVGGL
jgi:RNA polymerase sigma-32 factor